MRATRAYLAGFGTSGSLLAGAAALFLLGSAIVAFKGWPQIGGGSATSNVTAAPIPAASPIARRLSVVLAATRSRTPRAHVARASVRSATLRAPTGTRLSGVGARSPGTTSAPPPGSAATSSAGAATVVPGVTGCGSCGHSSNPVTSLSDAVTRTVSTVGTDVGTQIKNLGNSAGGQVGSVSPPVGNTVTSATSTVAGTVTTATNTVTSVVGSATGGGH